MPGFFPLAGRYGYHPYYLPPGSMPYHAPPYQTGVPNQNLLHPMHAYPPSVDIPVHPAGYCSASPFSNTSGGSNNATHSCPHVPLLSADKLSIPTLKAWLRHLDNQPHWHLPDVKHFQDFLTELEKEFNLLSQLASLQVSCEYMSGLLSIKRGTALSLLDYAREDMVALRTGDLVLSDV